MATPAVGHRISVTPSTLQVEVKEFNALASKVNGATQYLFKVEFHPSGASAVNTTDKFEAQIPLHAPTLEEALMILHAVGEQVKNQTPQDFHQMMQKLQYHAVQISAVDPKTGKYGVDFHRLDNVGGNFTKAHGCSIAKTTYDEIVQYAKVLSTSQPLTNLPPVVQPVVELQRTQTRTEMQVNMVRNDKRELLQKLMDNVPALLQYAQSDNVSIDQEVIELFESCFGTITDKSKMFEQMRDSIKTKIIEDDAHLLAEFNSIDSSMTEESIKAYLQFYIAHCDKLSA